MVLVRPETLVRWHRAGLRRYWRRKSRSTGGRPPIHAELRALIWRMSVDNRLWGAPHIHGELLKLGFAVAQSTVAKYMAKKGDPSGQRARSCATICRTSLPWICFWTGKVEYLYLDLTAATIEAVDDATPLRWHTKFSAVRSAVKIARAGPRTTAITCPGAIWSPSAHLVVISTVGLAIGAGGLDVALAMSGEPFPTTMPAIFGVRLVGELPGWVIASLRLNLLGCPLGRPFRPQGPQSLTLDSHRLAKRGTGRPLVAPFPLASPARFSRSIQEPD